IERGAAALRNRENIVGRAGIALDVLNIVDREHRPGVIICDRAGGGIGEVDVVTRAGSYREDHGLVELIVAVSGRINGYGGSRTAGRESDRTARRGESDGARLRVIRVKGGRAAY